MDCCYGKQIALLLVLDNEELKSRDFLLPETVIREPARREAPGKHGQPSLHFSLEKKDPRQRIAAQGLFARQSS